MRLHIGPLLFPVVVEFSWGTVIVSGRILGFFVRLDVEFEVVKVLIVFIVVALQSARHVCGQIRLSDGFVHWLSKHEDESLREQLYWSQINPKYPSLHSQEHVAKLKNALVTQLLELQFEVITCNSEVVVGKSEVVSDDSELGQLIPHANGHIANSSYTEQFINFLAHPRPTG